MKEFDWEKVISLNIYFLRLVGLWPDDTYKLDLYTLYAIVSVNLFSVSHVLFQTINVIFVYSNLDALTEEIFLCVAETLAVWKIYMFIINMKRLKRLMENLKHARFQPKNRRQRNIVQPSFDLWKMVFHALLSAVCPASILWLAFPILSGSFRKHSLPFMAWYPYDYAKSPFYELTYLYQIVSSVLIGLADYNIDMYISALMMYVAVQCDLLCDNLRHMGVSSNDFEASLEECVKHHWTILRFAQNCNEFFNSMMLGQFFASSVCMGLSLFQLTMVSPNSLDFYILLFTCFSMVTQIFSYCWFGEIVSQKSNQILYAAFESPWFEQPIKTQKNLIIFMENAQEPIKLSTFNMFYLSLDTFTKIVKSAWSYYTLLKQLSRQEH